MSEHKIPGIFFKCYFLFLIPVVLIAPSGTCWGITKVLSTTPVPAAVSVAANINIVVQFDEDIDGSTVTSDNFVVHGSFSGKVAGVISSTGNTDEISFNPSVNFLFGEKVTVTVTDQIRNSVGEWIWGYSFQFFIKAPRGKGILSESGSQLGGNSSSLDVSMGDFDGDRDLDAVVVNNSVANKVWLNNGEGLFTDSGQSLGISYCIGSALGDVEGDGDLDVVEAVFPCTTCEGSNRLWLNNGSGGFSNSGQNLGKYFTWAVAIGDVDNDGWLDIVLANQNQPNRVLKNNRNGVFNDSGQALGGSLSQCIALGDVDGDGFLDMVVANYNQANRVWFNDNTGGFSDSGQNLGSSNSMGVSLGDVDGDGDLDAFVANSEQPNRVWLNNGSGSFTDSMQTLGSSKSHDISLGDVDGDGDLDAVVANWNQANRVWLNNGSGIFTDSGQEMQNTGSYGIALGDVNGDNALDAVVVNNNSVNRVWLNSINQLNLPGIYFLLNQ
jgi:hypothetical protein